MKKMIMMLAICCMAGTASLQAAADCEKECCKGKKCKVECKEDGKKCCVEGNNACCAKEKAAAKEEKGCCAKGGKKSCKKDKAEKNKA